MRDCNWLEKAATALKARHRVSQCCALHVAERLSALVMERLTPKTAHAMLALLPKREIAHLRELRSSADSGPDVSIGYPDFLERAALAAGCHSTKLQGSNLPEGLVDSFLESLGQALPLELGNRLQAELPHHVRRLFSPAASAPVAA